MARYLVVAYQTAGSPELVQRVAQLAADDPEPTWVTLLLPARPPAGGPESEEAIRQEARTAVELLEREAHVHVGVVEVGDVSPMLAIEDALNALPGEYEAIVLSTLPPGVSRWLRMEVPEQVRQRFGLPVIHVASSAPTRQAADPA